MSENVVTVAVPFSRRKVSLTKAEWRACRRIENMLAAVLVVLGSAVVAAGVVLQGLMPIGMMIVFAVALVYFDGYVSRWWALRDAAPASRA